MLVTTGAKMSLWRLTSHVGAGSSEHCFAGDFIRICVTSSTVAGWKSISGSSMSRSSICGGGDVAVDTRIRSTFDAKNWAKSVAVEDVTMADSGSSRGLSFDHSALALLPHDSMAADQKLANFDWNSTRWLSNCVRQADLDSAEGRRRYAFSSFLVVTFIWWQPVSNHGAVGRALTHFTIW